MENIKNIVFDFGVVILNLNRPACMQAFKELGISDIENMTSLAIHKGIFAQLELGNVSVEEFYDNVRMLAGKQISDGQIRQAWLKMVSDIPSFKLDFLLELRKKYRVFLLSNTNEIHWNHCVQTMFNYKNHTVEDYFEKIWLSNEIHLLKPAPEIFRYILEDAQINPEETMFMDDAPANCQTARELGFRTYQPVAEEDWRHLFAL